MKIEVEQNDLRPLVQLVVDQTIERIEVAKAKVSGDRLAYPESEAAMLLGLATHSLRDSRLRGEVVASRIGKKVIYERSELIRLLTSRRIQNGNED